MELGPRNGHFPRFHSVFQCDLDGSEIPAAL